MRRLLWLLAPLVAALPLPARAEPGAPHVDADGTWHAPTAVRTSQGTEPAVVALPDLPPGGVATYTVDFLVHRPASPEVADRSLRALRLGAACGAIEVALDGAVLWRSPGIPEARHLDCHGPHTIALPAALLAPGVHQLRVDVAGPPPERVGARARASRLPPLALGWYDRLATPSAGSLAAARFAPAAAIGALLLAGSYLACLGRLRRRDPATAAAGDLGLVAGVALASIAWPSLAAVLTSAWHLNPFHHGVAAEMLHLAVAAALATAGVRFLLRSAGLRWQGLETALALQVVLWPLWLSGVASVAGRLPLSLQGAAGVAQLALLAQVAVAARAHLRASPWRAALSAHWGVALGVAIAAGAAVALHVLRQRPAWTHAEGIDLAQTVLVPTLAAACGALLSLRLLHQVGRARQEAERANALLDQRIREATAEIERNFRQLAELRVEQVTERERKRIAGDLHDDLGAKLLTIVHTSESERISTLAREALEEMRLSVRGLTGRPLQLIDALGDWRVEVVSRLSQAGIECGWSAPDDPEWSQRLSSRAYVQTTRILREATSNIIKHSGASRVEVRCAVVEGDFQLVIQDNGNGISADVDRRIDRGHGLASMKSRAKQLQGQCLVESAPGYGTVIRLTVPMDRATEGGGTSG